jgi:hypothetical protein
MPIPGWWSGDTDESQPSPDRISGSVKALTKYYNGSHVNLATLDPFNEALNIYQNHASNDKGTAISIVNSVSDGVDKVGATMFFTKVEECINKI